MAQLCSRSQLRPRRRRPPPARRRLLSAMAFTGDEVCSEAVSHWLRTYFDPDVLQTQPLGRVPVAAAVTHQNQSGFNLLQYICYLIDLGAEGKKIYQIPLEELLAFPGLSKLVNVETTPSVAYPYNHRTPYGILAMRPKLLTIIAQKRRRSRCSLVRPCRTSVVFLNTIVSLT